MGQNTTPVRHVKPSRGVSDFAVCGPQTGRGGRSPEAAGQVPALGNTRNHALPQVRGFLPEAGSGLNPKISEERRAQLGRRRDRFAARAFLWDISSLRRVKACGRTSISTGGVGMRVQGDGDDRFAGYSHVARCGSVWSCPTCSAKIAAVRASELAEGLTLWGKAGKGLTFVTLTMRHHKGQRLADLWDGVSSAWAAITRGAAWTGSKCRGTRKNEEGRPCGGGCKHQLGDKARFGIVGTVRATEVTHGKNGWHVHLHVLVFTKEPLSDSADEGPGDDAGDLGIAMFMRWKKRLVKEGFAAPMMLQGGLDVQTVSGEAAERKVGEYLAKATYEGAGWETAGGATKKGRGSGRSPFQILHDLRTTGEGLDLWTEWERGSKGRRQIVWSRGLFETVFGMTRKEMTDQEAVDEEMGGDELGRFTQDGWRSMCGQPTRLPEALEVAEEQPTVDTSREAVAAWCRERRIGFRTETDVDLGIEREPDVSVFDRRHDLPDRSSCRVPALGNRQIKRAAPVNPSTLTDEQRQHLAKMAAKTALLPS